MRDLGPSARHLIELARHEDEPGEAARERVQEALLARIGTGAAAGSLASPGSRLPAAAGNSALGLKGSLAFVALLATGGGYALYSQRPAVLDSRSANGTSVAAPKPASPAPRQSEPIRTTGRAAEMTLRPSADGPNSDLGRTTAAEARQPTERSSTARESASAGSAPPAASSLERSADHATDARVSAKERGAMGELPTAQAEHGHESPELAARAKEASPSDELLAEARALRDVQQALRAGDSPRALALLAEQERRFARGQLGAARAAARAMALCKGQGAAERRSTAARFEAAWPRSPLLPSVRTACGSESNESKRER